jgi:hypothetical protein
MEYFELQCGEPVEVFHEDQWQLATTRLINERYCIFEINKDPVVIYDLSLVRFIEPEPEPEEMKKVVDDMVMCCKYSYAKSTREDCISLYKAGYRKMPTVKK